MPPEPRSAWRDPVGDPGLEPTTLVCVAESAAEAQGILETAVHDSLMELSEDILDREVRSEERANRNG